jgi:arylsulfatase A-like enzyme
MTETREVCGWLRGREFSRLLSLLALLLLGPSAGVTAADRSQGPIVVYVIDTLRADRVSVYGAPHPTTPAAEQLASEGIVFENAYSLSSWTRPSVATLLTSQLPASTGAIDRYGVLDPAIPYLPEMLKRSGWKTAAFVTNGNIFDQRLGFQRGFDTFRPVLGLGHPGKAYASEAMEPAVHYVQGQTSRKFFLYIHVVDPHDRPDASMGRNVYDLEPPYKGLFGDGVSTSPSAPSSRVPLDYDRAIRQADDQFARLVTVLKVRGFWDSALVIYTADHGEEFGEHGGWGHGQTLYEEQIHIPLIVKPPGGMARKARRSDLVSLADVVPTIADVARLPPSSDWVGQSLLQKSAEKTLYFSEDLDGFRLYASRRGFEKLIVSLYPRVEQRLFFLGRDAEEKAGISVSGDAAVSAAPNSLARITRDLRARELASYPALWLEKTRLEPIRIDLKVNLSGIKKPFLTVEDATHFSLMIENEALTVRQIVPWDESFRLLLSTNTQGELPLFRLNVFSERTHLAIDMHSSASPFRISKTMRPTLHGPTTDEVIVNLRSLGYLRGF